MFKYVFSSLYLTVSVTSVLFSYIVFTPSKQDNTVIVNNLIADVIDVSSDSISPTEEVIFDVEEKVTEDCDVSISNNTTEEVIFDVEEKVTEDCNVSVFNAPYSLIIPSVGLSATFNIGDHSQVSVDTYDIVFTKDIYDYDGTIRFLGHNTRSFSSLCNTSVGDFIYIIDENGISHSYSVCVSESGTLTDDGFDIISNVTNKCLTNKGYVELVTCYGDFNNRWVVLCEKVQ